MDQRVCDGGGVSKVNFDQLRPLSWSSQIISFTNLYIFLTNSGHFYQLETFLTNSRNFWPTQTFFIPIQAMFWPTHAMFDQLRINIGGWPAKLSHPWIILIIFFIYLFFIYLFIHFPTNHGTTLTSWWWGQGGARWWWQWWKATQNMG